MRNSRPWLPWMLLVLGLGLLLLSGSGVLGPLENFLGYLVSPIENGVSAIFDTLSTLTRSTRDVRQLQQYVAELEQANEALVQENFRLREYQAENAELRRELNFKRDNPTYGWVGADIVTQGCSLFPCGEVVGLDTNPYLRYPIINVGARDGVAVGMPVVTGGAMVGRIVHTSASLSYVQLITDPESQVAGLVQQSRVSGMVEGSREGYIIMTQILPDERVNIGETIITSAVGGMLPRGLILGQVEEVLYQESELFQRAVIRPAVDFRRLETVLVITDFERPDLEELEELAVP